MKILFRRFGGVVFIVYLCTAKVLQEASEAHFPHAPVAGYRQNNKKKTLYIATMASRQLILHNDVQQIEQLEGYIEAIAEDTGIDPSLAMSLNLALEEAVTNVILYAYPEGTDGTVDIVADSDGQQVTFTVTDNGKPFDPTAQAEADVTLGVEDRPIGGLGIFLVRNIMDSVEYSRVDGKNILRMQKKL
ncbi:MAG: ATP-binding protein [Prevotella sp.]|nr:ATP-binding protein [Prevotella sp.]